MKKNLINCRESIKRFIIKMIYLMNLIIYETYSLVLYLLWYLTGIITWNNRGERPMLGE